MELTRRTTCRACGGERLLPFLSLGPTPLANAFLAHPDDFVAEPSYPLDLYFCEDCSLVQLLDVVDPEVLFRDYIYVTGTSDTIAAHNEAYAEAVIDRLGLAPDDLVVEVASNDGSLLRCFDECGVRTLGVEPARNLADLAWSRGIETVAEFFNEETARHVRDEWGAARAVIGNNVLAHVDDTQGFLCGCRHLLADDGLAIIEVPYLGEFLDRLEYDTVYHEHLCYFSVTALLHLCDAVGLSIVHIDHVPVHGGSLRIHAGRPDYYGGHDESVLALSEEEHEAGLTSASQYKAFADAVRDQAQRLVALLRDLKRRGKTVVGYGAPAKGNTLLNYCEIGTDLVPYTVDKNSMKVGRYTPGMHLPVRPVETLLEEQPDYVLILAWNFATEIMEQQRAYRERGGQFILPIPEPMILA